MAFALMTKAVARTRTLLPVLALVMAGSTINAAQAVSGTVNVTGNILSNSCQIAVGDRNKTVNLGPTSIKQFQNGSIYGPRMSFLIHLSGCGPTASGVSVTFYGTPDSADSTLLALDGGTGVATGVGVELQQGVGHTVLPINTAGAVVLLTPGADSVTLPFSARYKANGTAVASGQANASATFVLTYS